MAAMQSTLSSWITKTVNLFNRLRLGLMRRFQSDSSVLGRGWKWLTDWLAVVTWKRLFVVSMLLFILGGLLTAALEEMFYSTRTSVQVIDDKPAKNTDSKKTKIVITADEKGVRVNTIPADAPAEPAPPAPPIPPDAPALPEGATKPDAQESKVIAERKGVQIVVDAKRNLPEDVQDLLDEIKTSIEGSIEENTAPTTKTIVNTVKPSVPAVFMNLVALLVFSLIALKVIMNTQRKAQAKVAVAEEATEREALKRQLTEARLTTMQAQVEPHFLFNTLASVDHLIETAPQRASQMQKSLIQYLRAAMPHMRDTTSNMGREAQLVRSYLEILKFRMEERLDFSVDVPAGLATAEIPPMMLLSLVENAIKHGLEPKPEGGRVDVKAEIAHGKLRVTVADTGLGYRPNNSLTRGTGVGLANIHERLAMLYPGKAKLTVGPNQTVGTLCVLELPYRVSEQMQTA
jgi:two-component sensor histidine kinase